MTEQTQSDEVQIGIWKSGWGNWRMRNVSSTVVRKEMSDRSQISRQVIALSDSCKFDGITAIGHVYILIRAEFTYVVFFSS